MEQTNLSYETARDLIQDGQIIFCRGYTWFHKLVNWATDGSFTHCGIALWMTDDYGRKKLMCVESSVGGARVVTLRAYAFRGMTVVDVDLDWNKFGDAPLDQTGTLHYNYLNFALLGVKGLLLKMRQVRIASWIKPHHGKVCSEFVAEYLNDAGVVAETFVSPNQLYKMVIVSKQYAGLLQIEPQKIVS